MPSLHDMYAKGWAAPLLMQQFGERGHDGSFSGVKYYAPQQPEGTEWAASVGQLEIEDDPNDDGTSSHQEKERKESCNLDGATPAFELLKNGSFEVAKYPGERFEIERIELGGAMTRVRVYRYVTEGLQRRGFERGN